MKLSIRYSLRARQEEMELLDYVLQNFGQKKAKEIYFLLEKRLDQLSGSPEMYRESNKRKGLRKCVFSKQTSIYYRIKEDHIEIVSFRPNRKNPNKFMV
ncbi:type II toxin-antitoxin system RelE/ParE family toxin [Cyclobacterium sp. 1_MG-2023]|uniref:type II toxin-antitoxin system RelE/ParE family toxin n=1 Tax=Cyclobacterium sp. 1_MG-2023 TaxID=3062681 RepID=UPI0026E42C82|nr:type II toxin-antitoxin system RelE/ParE family toxin [Cyclobacterium sp. 1_MG-2023]MDO6437929.1 type II toxin-antitoxin system RelE/ParE family toxin [Cyclobacterium sp. 1_MG-2023]